MLAKAVVSLYLQNMAAGAERHISRYRTSPGIEGEYEPRSHGRVLRNLLGITRKRQMDRREYEALVKAQRRYLGRITAETVFTAELVCQMHREWLGRIYPWAGKLRTVEMAKGGFRWPPARFIHQSLQELERQTLRRCTPCRPGPVAEVAASLAEVQAELLLVHPFREGNGRIARWLCDLMAMQAGLPALDYGFVGRGSRARRLRYLQAVRLGYDRRYEPLARFLAQAVERGLAAATP
jgi:cell filamentation protein